MAHKTQTEACKTMEKKNMQNMGPQDQTVHSERINDCSWPETGSTG